MIKIINSDKKRELKNKNISVSTQNFIIKLFSKQHLHITAVLLKSIYKNLFLQNSGFNKKCR